MRGMRRQRRKWRNTNESYYEQATCQQGNLVTTLKTAVKQLTPKHPDQSIKPHNPVLFHLRNFVGIPLGVNPCQTNLLLWQRVQMLWVLLMTTMMNLPMPRMFIRAGIESTTKQLPLVHSCCCLLVSSLSNPSQSTCSSTCTATLLTSSSTFDDVNLDAANVFKPMGCSPIPIDACLTDGNHESVDGFCTPDLLTHAIRVDLTIWQTETTSHVTLMTHATGTMTALTMFASLSTLLVPWSPAQGTNQSSTTASRTQSCTLAKCAVKELSAMIKPSSQKRTA